VAVLVAEKVVKVAHPYLGDDVEMRLWSPLEYVDDVKAALAPHSAATSVCATAVSDAPETVVYCVKNKKPSSSTRSQPSSNRSNDGKSVDSLRKKSSVDNLQSQSGTEAVPTQQVVPGLTSDADNRDLKRLSIKADSEIQFRLLKKMLGSSFAHKHGCTFTADIHQRTITLSSEREDCISLCAEEIYGYKKDGIFEEEVHISSGLAQLLYTKHRHWLCDRLRVKMSEPTVPKMTSGSDSRLVVVALSQTTARQAADMLRAGLLRAKVPLTDLQHKYVNSTKLRKKLNKIAADKAVDVKTGAHVITIDGLPHDVVCAVSEIGQCL